MPPTFTSVDNIEFVVADDEEENLDVASMSLALSGCDEEKLVKVNCGDDAIEKVKELQSVDPDMPLEFLLDLNMPPGKSGSGGIGKTSNVSELLRRQGIRHKSTVICETFRSFYFQAIHTGIRRTVDDSY